jgi:hypothetical protein
LRDAASTQALEKVLTLEAAIHRLSRPPAAQLGLNDRRRIEGDTLPTWPRSIQWS